MIYSKNEAKELDRKIEQLNNLNTQRLSLLANISTASLMNALKACTSFKVTHKNDNNDIITSYVNEKNFYGSRPNLSHNGILLYLYLHFLNVSEGGKVLFIPSEAATFLNVSKKTIKRAIKSLMIHDYIIYEKNPVTGYYDVIINGFDTIGEERQGYTTISLEFFKKLITGCENINELRLCLRGLVSCNKGLHHNRFEGSAFIEIRKLFPSYVKIADIKRMAVKDQTATLFNVFLDKKTVTLRLKEKFNPAVIKDKKVSAFRKEVTKLIKKLNAKKEYKNNLLKINENDITDISKIVLRLPEENVIAGINKLFEKYSFKTSRNIGALVRVLSEENYFNSLQTP